MQVSDKTGVIWVANPVKHLLAGSGINKISAEQRQAFLSRCSKPWEVLVTGKQVAMLKAKERIGQDSNKMLHPQYIWEGNNSCQGAHLATDCYHYHFHRCLLRVTLVPLLHHLSIKPHCPTAKEPSLRVDPVYLKVHPK